MSQKPSRRRLTMSAIFAATIGLHAPALSPAISQALAQTSAREVEIGYAELPGWRILKIERGGRFVHCAAETTGDAGEIRIAKISSRGWTVSVPASNRRGKIRASVGSEQLTLQSDGRRAWWVVGNAPYWGEPGQEAEMDVNLDPNNRNAKPLHWSLRGYQAALQAVEACHASAAL